LAAVLAEAQKEIGEPYAGPLSDYPDSSRFDGPGPHDGWDCSSFVAGMYKRALGIDLPAYTDAIHDRCDELAPDQVVPGTIVLWEYRDGIQSARFPHVGLVWSSDRTQVIDCRYPAGVGIRATLPYKKVYVRPPGVKAS
jgi:cell wall-associated NlpC family hydrolase